MRLSSDTELSTNLLRILLVHLVLHLRDVPFWHELNDDEEISWYRWKHLRKESTWDLKNSIHDFAVLTSRSVVFDISKKPFAVNFIFVVINCEEKFSSCVNKAWLYNLCKRSEMVLYSLEAALQEQKIPINEIKGGRQRMKAAERKKNAFQCSPGYFLKQVTDKVEVKKTVNESCVHPVDINDKDGQLACYRNQQAESKSLIQQLRQMPQLNRCFLHKPQPSIVAAHDLRF